MAASAEHNGTYPPINDYGLIGNCRTSALVSRDGSIDWLCMPRCDSDAFFAALLDLNKGGRFRIRPVGSFSSKRGYISNTPIIENTYRCPTGTIVLRDFFVVGTEEEKEAVFTPSHEILRQVEGVEGEVQIEILYQPRPGFAVKPPRLDDRGALGLFCDLSCDGGVILRGDVSLKVAENGSEAAATATVRAGESRWFSLSYSSDAPAIIPPLGDAAAEKFAQTLRWWQKWEERCSYRGPYRDEILRSAMALKLMIHAPSGAIIAAPTTSLPEKIGGIRNWDYRYCWLRDASFTLRALFSLGYTDDEEAFVDWMLHLTRLTWPGLQVLYDVYGESHLPERELGHLDGYAHSRPVRVGNKAHEQFQLDVYGEVIDAVVAAASRGPRFNRDTVRMLDGMGKMVCKRWRDPDDGIWEIRSAPQQHTHSKILAWVALDRLISLHDLGYQLSVDLFRREREKLRAEIESRGYNERIGSYTSTFDGHLVDASLLLLPHYGYLSGSDPRMVSTYRRIREKLGKGPLLQRYEEGTRDGLPPGEGTFGTCSFWGVECQARSGDLAGARKTFEQLLCYGNDLGLYSEETAPEGEALGNFPQAFTHIGLINAAVTLAEMEQK